MKYGDLSRLWATLSPSHEVWRDVAVLPEVRYTVDIVRRQTGTRREPWIAREVSCTSPGTVSVHKPHSSEEGQDTEFLME